MHIIALYIILGIILLVALLLCLRANLRIVYEDDLQIYIRVLCFKYYLYPQKRKKFNPQALKIKNKNKKKSAETVIKKHNESNGKPSLLDKLSIIKNVLSVFLKSFSRHLRVKLSKMHISIGTEDAAKTAILYGAVSGAAAGIIELIDSYANLKKLKTCAMMIEPDFLSDKIRASIDITLSVSIWGALITLIKSFWKYTILKNSK